MPTLWLQNDQIKINQRGAVIECDNCPCGQQDIECGFCNPPFNIPQVLSVEFQGISNTPVSGEACPLGNIPSIGRPVVMGDCSRLNGTYEVDFDPDSFFIDPATGDISGICTGSTFFGDTGCCCWKLDPEKNLCGGASIGAPWDVESVNVTLTQSGSQFLMEAGFPGSKCHEYSYIRFTRQFPERPFCNGFNAVSLVPNRNPVFGENFCTEENATCLVTALL